MKNPRIVYLIPVGGVVALAVFGLMLYAGFLTSSWGTLLACTPAVLATIAIVTGMLGGAFLFSAEEGETREEAARRDGAELFDELGRRIATLVQRLTHRPHAG